MSLKNLLLKRINTLLSRGGLEIAGKATLDHLRSEIYETLPNHQREALAYFFGSTAATTRNLHPLPSGAAQYLNTENSRLLALKKAYEKLNIAATYHSAWGDDRVSEMDLQYFRCDSPYVWQDRDNNFEVNYVLTSYYVKIIDALGLFDRLQEDRLFGVSAFEVENGTLVSRDFLDAILEINFLARVLGRAYFKNANILDIGAGYGRFAHRLVNAIPETGKIFCVDAVPESTFLCEYYLRFRKVEEKAVTIPLQDIKDLFRQRSIQLATNIHSFSECTLAAIKWWLDLLRESSVKYLFVAPNRVETDHDGVPQLLSREVSGPGRDFFTEILSRGYKLIRKEPKFLDPMAQKYGVSPTGYYLFELA
jgi:SAM-dependent methyltransferase